MLAKVALALPAGEGFLFEPKWDGFRAIAFRGDTEVYIQSGISNHWIATSRSLHDVLLERLPQGCVVDGEIVIATSQGLDFDALQLRLHPAQSRVAKLAREAPSSFVAFDVLAAGGHDVRAESFARRRARLEKLSWEPDLRST
jgi:ATP-dependent DNA ligase